MHILISSPVYSTCCTDTCLSNPPSTARLTMSLKMYGSFCVFMLSSHLQMYLSSHYSCFIDREQYYNLNDSKAKAVRCLYCYLTPRHNRGIILHVHPHYFHFFICLLYSFCSLSVMVTKTLLGEGHFLMKDIENRINTQFLSSVRQSKTL